jgi:hypothetical protein
MSTRDQGEQGKDSEDTEDTEGHVYVPKDERAGGIAGLPEKRGTVGPIDEEEQRRHLL